jgi:hypothetical protein
MTQQVEISSHAKDAIGRDQQNTNPSFHSLLCLAKCHSGPAGLTADRRQPGLLSTEAEPRSKAEVDRERLSSPIAVV